MSKHLTLCLVRSGNRLLLGYKKRGFGAKQWNGFGGKVEAGETIITASRRELREEAGIQAESLIKVAEIEFNFVAEATNLLVHVFLTDKFTGQIRESEEMKPAWFDLEQIPYEEMWPDDKYWLPLVLAGQKIKASFTFVSVADKTISQQVVTKVKDF